MDIGRVRKGSQSKGLGYGRAAVQPWSQPEGTEDDAAHIDNPFHGDPAVLEPAPVGKERIQKPRDEAPKGPWNAIPIVPYPL